VKTTRNSDYNSVFALKLRSLLENKSISMTLLANELGVKQQTVSQWADGSTTPALKHLKPLASYFGISIDELVTGVTFENEEVHSNTGLSNLAIEILKQLNADDIDNDVFNVIKAIRNEQRGVEGCCKKLSPLRAAYLPGENRIIIEFLNVIIESMNSKSYSLSRLARLCMDYIIGAHEHILWQDDVIKKEAKGWTYLVHIDRPNYKNDDLDFKTYQLTKDFEYFIEHLAKNSKIAERAKKIYMDGNFGLPDYSDSRFKPGAIVDESALEKYPIEFLDTEEASDKENDVTNS